MSGSGSAEVRCAKNVHLTVFNNAGKAGAAGSRNLHLVPNNVDEGTQAG